MEIKQAAEKWRAMSEEVITGLKEWRGQHPQATLREIETTLDERLARLRAQMLQDTALVSQARDWRGAAAGIPCPECGQELKVRGKQKRQLQTNGGQEVVLEREYGECPGCGTGLFPLDEELELLPGSLTPQAHECLVRLGTWVPSFEQAAKELAATLKVRVSEAMSRRQTEAAGAAYVAVQQQEVERIEQELPLAPVGADKIQVSVDGAMVPLVGGEWTEVKTVAIGEIGETVRSDGQRLVQTKNITYFSRRAEAQQFNRLALGEMHRRGVEPAQQVAAPADGAEWVQRFIDFHCPQAVRILDFAHAAERINQVGQASLEPDETQPWLAQQLHQLKHDGPAGLLLELQRLQTDQPTLEIVAANLAYLQKRETQMQYPTFRVQGLPIGSGAVESAHKVVVEPRLKGAGMHWAPHHVNPMVALRTLVCNDRWAEDWPKIATQLRQETTARQRALSEKRRSLKLAQSQPPALSTPPVTQTTLTPASPASVSPPDQKTSPSPPQKQIPYRPAPNHPWRRSPIGRARFLSTKFSKN